MTRLMKRACCTAAITVAPLLAGSLMLDHRPAGDPAMAARRAAAGAMDPCAQDGGVALNEQEREMGRRLESDPGQQRGRIVLNPTLARVARQRAQDMASRSYLSHTDPDGLGPNMLATRAGYRLPGYYDASAAGNNIESIGGGYAAAEVAWADWMSSPAHRAHLLGLDPFYRDQTEYGVGYAYAPGTDWGHYWAVLIAEPAC